MNHKNGPKIKSFRALCFLAKCTVSVYVNISIPQCIGESGQVHHWNRNLAIQIHIINGAMPKIVCFLNPSGTFPNFWDWKFRFFSVLFEQNEIILGTWNIQKVTLILRYKPENYQQFRPLISFTSFKNPNIANMFKVDNYLLL